MAVIAVLIIIIWLAKISGVTDNLSLEKIRSSVEALGSYGALLFVAIYAIATMVGLPGTIITIAGGLIFGTWLGGTLNLIGAIIGASGGFWIARLAARELVEGSFKNKEWFAKFEDGLKEDGLSYMLFVRLVPIFPFNGVNFGAGLTSVSFKNYFVGSLIGMAPATFIYTNVASEIGKSAEDGFSISGGAVASLALLGALALLPIAIKKLKKKR